MSKQKEIIEISPNFRKHMIDRRFKGYKSREMTYQAIQRGLVKDKRSKNITNADVERAKKMFAKKVNSELLRNPGMSMKEAMDKVENTRSFTSYEQISSRNVSKAAREFGIRVKADGLVNIDSNSWEIVSGPHAGHILQLTDNPGSYPSYIIQII